VNRTGAPGSVASGCAGMTRGFRVARLPLEDETARVRSPSGTRLALHRVSFEYSVLRHLPLASGGRADLESEPAGWQAPSRKRVGGRPLRVGTAALLSWKVRRRRGNGL